MYDVFVYSSASSQITSWCIYLWIWGLCGYMVSHASCFFVEVTVNCCVNFLIHSEKRFKPLMMQITECDYLTYWSLILFFQIARRSFIYHLTFIFSLRKNPSERHDIHYYTVSLRDTKLILNNAHHSVLLIIDWNAVKHGGFYHNAQHLGMSITINI